MGDLRTCVCVPLLQSEEVLRNWTRRVWVWKKNIDEKSRCLHKTEPTTPPHLSWGRGSDLEFKGMEYGSDVLSSSLRGEIRYSIAVIVQRVKMAES